jgi:hypothetical protein
MPEPPTFDKPRIVAMLNRKYGTTLSVELFEIAVTHRFTSWEVLAAEADEVPQRTADD